MQVKELYRNTKQLNYTLKTSLKASFLNLFLLPQADIELVQYFDI